MAHLYLNREMRWSGDFGTFGKLDVRLNLQHPKASAGVLLGEFYTVEQPWTENTPFKSCIPAGEYFLVPYVSPKYNLTYMIIGGQVGPDIGNDTILREDCLIHVANYPRNVQGCIGVGKEYTTTPEPMVTNSRDSIEALKELAPVSEIHRLSIRWC